jgi:RNA polymerase sigma factor (sigma-70 family)
MLLWDRGPVVDTADMALGERFPSILAAAQSGAEWAWDVLYQELAGALLGYLRLGEAAEPADLLGEVFLHLARNIGTFEGNEAGFRSWAFMVAHHRLIDDRRLRARRRDEPAGLSELERLGGVGDVEQEAMERLSVAAVREVIARLTPYQREVLLLRILGGLTVEEIARILGKRVGAIKALQRRGLAAIRREIEREGVPL